MRHVAVHWAGRVARDCLRLRPLFLLVEVPSGWWRRQLQEPRETEGQIPRDAEVEAHLMAVYGAT